MNFAAIKNKSITGLTFLENSSLSHPGQDQFNDIGLQEAKNSYSD